MRSLLRPAALLALAAVATACGGSEDQGAAVDSGAQPADSGAIDSGPPIDAPVNETCAASDEPDDKGADDNCDGADGVVGRDVYVDPKSGSDTNIGSPTKPLRTIAAALTLAKSRTGNVLVAAGEITDLERIAAPGPWHVFGGYSASFVGAPRRDATVLAVSAAGLSIEGETDGALHHLTVRGASAKDSAARSAHAVRSSITRLTLDDVVLEAGDALPGAPGTKGLKGQDKPQASTSRSAPTDADELCDGVRQPLYAFGATAGNASAEGKPAGVVNTTTPSSSTPAGSGSAGEPGTDGADASKLPVIQAGLITWQSGTAGAADGKSGYGGAGGGRWYVGIQPYSGGYGGMGGCPGKGGTPGTSGGGSVALVVLKGEVKIARSILRTGLGGSGGDGGEGGGGGNGGAGSVPTGPKSWPPTCTPSTDPIMSNCAAYGGAGGNGGLGGRGGGGAGGWTIGAATVASAVVDADPTTVFELGKPGTGGAGNAGGRAPSGEKRNTLRVD